MSQSSGHNPNASNDAIVGNGRQTEDMGLGSIEGRVLV